MENVLEIADEIKDALNYWDELAEQDQMYQDWLMDEFDNEFNTLDSAEDWFDFRLRHALKCRRSL